MLSIKDKFTHKHKDTSTIDLFLSFDISQGLNEAYRQTTKINASLH